MRREINGTGKNNISLKIKIKINKYMIIKIKFAKNTKFIFCIVNFG
jgi:hypothetical protein